jgi:gamma-glutamyltranspeptidase/glutathione hydrolase
MSELTDTFDSRLFPDAPQKKAAPEKKAASRSAGFTTRPEIWGSVGAISTTHWLATASGMAILERGGNAFDAAATAAFVLQVAVPEFTGMAGELVMLIKPRDADQASVVCGQGVAPCAASLATFERLGLAAVPERGFIAATTPGAFDAWMLMFRDHGRMSLRDVLSPAIGYATSGTRTSESLLSRLSRVEPFFQAEWPSSAAAIATLRPDTTGIGNRNPALAETMRRLIEAGEAAGGDRMEQIEAARAAFRGGFVADSIDRAARHSVAAELGGERYPGLIDGEDMTRWSASYEAPLTCRYGGFEVAKAGPWTQGPVLLQYLTLLRQIGIENISADDPAFVHFVIEAAKLVFADREQYYGDPLFVNVPTTTLLSDHYAERRARQIGQTAADQVAAGTIGIGDERQMPRLEEETDPQRIHARRTGTYPGATTSIAAVDHDGNMVAAVPSGGTFLESPFISELGFCLGTRGSGFRLARGHPNCLAPGKRPRTTLSPTLVMRNGEPFLACATPGADQQEQWQIAFLLRHLHHGLNLQEAIDAPMFQSEHFPSSFPPFRARRNRLVLEARFAAGFGDALRERGHHVVRTRNDWLLGALTAVAKDGRALKAAACPRGMKCYAIGR